MDQELVTILNAYGYERVKKCFLELHKDFVSRRKAYKDEQKAYGDAAISGDNGWEEFNPIVDPREPGEEWRVIDNRYFKRKIDQSRYYGQAQHGEAEKAIETIRAKTDLSMEQTDKICPECGGTLAWEPICPGCRLGRIGFKGRLVCMEDMDHEFYVLREGVILPNQGD